MLFRPRPKPRDYRLHFTYCRNPKVPPFCPGYRTIENPIQLASGYFHPWPELQSGFFIDGGARFVRISVKPNETVLRLERFSWGPAGFGGSNETPPVQHIDPQGACVEWPLIAISEKLFRASISPYI